MRIALSSCGSRGDVMPMIGISAALRDAGHQVRLCVPITFAEAARRRGLGADLRCYREDSAELMRRFGAGWKAARTALDWFTRQLEAQLAQLLEHSRDADVLVTSAAEIAAPTVAEYRGLPYFRVAYAPILPGDQPPPLQPFQRLPRWCNRALWAGLNGSLRLVLGRHLDRQRRRLGLPAVGSIADYFVARSHTLLAISERLAPPAVGWAPYCYSYTGYCFEQDGGALEPSLSRFLADGSPPVLVGFGSVNVADPRRFSRSVLAAVYRAGCRAVIARGWMGLGGYGAPERVFFCDEVPHRTLLPHLAGIAHHGGSGTVHSAARAGIPQFVMPQLADQFYWGQRVHELGLGPRPVPPRRLSTARLARALRALVRGDRYRRRVRQLGAQLQCEAGVARAAAIIGGAPA